ncbi:MAG: RHS repeat-associated core domain-containing protein, partial [Anaeroplasma sp.]|uniref:RHS repeat-associated core domain-containing protein n=1 Tax=Anaeroplasma sp. TaxID=1872523 RepID=UPI002A9204D8
GILNNSGVIVSKFDYDAFGNIINQTGTVISNFRYKGYYYDTDIELYYLKSRFYNPVLLIFITPDSIEYLDSSSIIGLNLYAYCGNDPVNMIDEEGNWWENF